MEPRYNPLPDVFAAFIIAVSSLVIGIIIEILVLRLLL